MQARTPLNPLLGETVQREMEDGTKYYAEQISHHPPITAFQLVGPEESYAFSCRCQLKG